MTARLRWTLAASLIAIVGFVLWRRTGAEPADTPTSVVSRAQHMGRDQPSASQAADIAAEATSVAARASDAPAEQSPIATAGDGRLAGGSARVRGIAVDGQQRPLAAHLVELERSEGLVEARAVTDDDGLFRIDGLQPGPWTLRLVGPRRGDVLAGCLTSAGGDCSQELVREERRMNLIVPADGLDRVTVCIPMHAARLIRLRVVDDLGRPHDYCWFELDNLTNIHSDSEGVICEPVVVDRDRSMRLNMGDDRLSRMLRRENEMAEASQRFVPVDIELRAEPVFQDLGTVVIPRAAGLALTLTDPSNGVAIGDADVRLACSGGGQPPAEVRGEMDEEGVYTLWSGRTAGEYTLDVGAAGYRPVHRIGVLVAGDEPQRLELVLERTR